MVYLYKGGFCFGGKFKLRKKIQSISRETLSLSECTILKVPALNNQRYLQCIGKISFIKLGQQGPYFLILI